MLLPYMYKYQPFLLVNLKMFTLPVLNFSMVIYHMLMRITGTNMYTVYIRKQFTINISSFKNA